MRNVKGDPSPLRSLLAALICLAVFAAYQGNTSDGNMANAALESPFDSGAHDTADISITGSILDKSSGYPLYGMSVTAHDANTGVTRWRSSGPDGAYAFTGLPPGTYTIMAYPGHTGNISESFRDEVLSEWYDSGSVSVTAPHSMDGIDIYMAYTADEDFETGPLDRVMNSGGDGNWTVTGDNPHRGMNALSSPEIGDGQTAWVENNLNCDAGTFKFWFSVDSEEESDFLRLYIDDRLEGAWSGAVDYTQNSFNIPGGVHSFRWEYMEEQGAFGDSGTAWVDDIFVTSKGGGMDMDSDGLTDEEEMETGTDPMDADTDDDGVPDGYEVHNFGTSPFAIDTDEDSIQDGTELGYTKAGPHTDLLVFIPDLDPASRTNPLAVDSDKDGYRDQEEDLNGNGRVDPGEFDAAYAEIFASLSGTVRDRETGLPLNGIDILAINPASAERVSWAHTGEEGIYTLHFLPAGNFIILASDQNTGYAFQFYADTNLKDQAIQVEVSVRKPVSGIDFELDAGAEITGRVFDINGNPVSGVMVRTCDTDMANCDDLPMAFTDEKGIYTLKGLPPGTFRVKLMPQRYSGYNAPYYFEPGSSAPSAPIAITAAETHAGIDFEISSLGTVSGSAAPSGPGAEECVKVTVVSVDANLLKTVCCDTEGNFTVGGLPTGDYYIHAFQISSGCSWRYGADEEIFEKPVHIEVPAVTPKVELLPAGCW